MAADEPMNEQPETQAPPVAAVLNDPGTTTAALEQAAEADVAPPAPPAPTPTSSSPPRRSEPAAGPASIVVGAPASEKKWYVVKVQSGREDTIREAVERRVKIEGLEDCFGQIVVPVERTTEMAKGKRITRTRKLYPGYLFVEVEFNDRILYLFRETPGVGDFVGAGLNKKPNPMPDAEVQKILTQKAEVVAAQPTVKIKFDRGERVKVKDGMFTGMEGEVSEILEGKGLVRVLLKVFGRDVPVELEYWQIEHL
jgi:transcriptional antiterminator NusG